MLFAYDRRIWHFLIDMRIHGCYFSIAQAGVAQLVEPHVANVIVASSSLVSRSFFWRRSQVVRQRSAKPPFIGSSPIAAFFRQNAGMAEMADARDLKSLGLQGRPGSIPGSGINRCRYYHFIQFVIRLILPGWAGASFIIASANVSFR